MTTKKQLNKNIILSEKLAEYLAKKFDILKKYENSSYVVFSDSDKELNRLNEKLAKDLIKDGNKVVKATKPKNSKNDWTFEPFLFS